MYNLWVLSGMILAEDPDHVFLRGAGASFPSPVYKSWTTNYMALRQEHVTLEASYEAVGSGTGKKRIMEDPLSVEYAGSDSLVEEKDYVLYPDIQMYPVIAG